MKESIIMFRISEKEKQKLQATAKRKGLSLSEYLRALILPKQSGKGA